MVGAIEVLDLTKRYGDAEAVSGLRFTIPRGQVYGLLGQNGAGKTTTLRILATLTPPTSGGARICGYDVQADSALVRRRIGYVSGELGPPAEPAWTPIRYWRFMGRIYGLGDEETRARAETMAQSLFLDEALHKPLGSLSSGTRRKIELVRAFLPRPPVILLDEPTRELDVLSREAAWAMFKAAAKRGATVLLSSHDAVEIQQVCDHLAMLHKGRLLAEGARETMLRGSEDPFRSLLSLLRGG